MSDDSTDSGDSQGGNQSDSGGGDQGGTKGDSNGDQDGQGSQGGQGGQGGQANQGRQGARGKEGKQGGQNQQGGQGSQQEQKVTLAQKAIIAVSVGFTLLLFTYAGWQIVTPPPAEAPQASVVGTSAYENGSVAVTVELRNPTDVGLVTATVESNCASPPPEVQFSFVPALSSRTGTLVCPPGTTNPSVSVASWVSR